MKGTQAMNKSCNSKGCKVTGGILLVLLVAIGAVLFLASKKPDEFKVTRTVTINAAPEVVFPWLNNLQNGQKWSPWVEMDPNAAYTFEGPVEGVGAIIHWEGKKSGKGMMTITESAPNERVVSRLDFEKPMASTNTTEYAMTPDENGGTQVAWTMQGKNKLINKMMSVFMNCEKIVGDQFDKGLANLKKIVEAE